MGGLLQIIISKRSQLFTLSSAFEVVSEVVCGVVILISVVMSHSGKFGGHD